MEDLIQFAIFVVVILFWLLGTGKKKPQRPPQRPQATRPRVPAQPRPTPTAGGPTPTAGRPAATRQAPPPARRQPETLADLLRDVLQGQLPDVTRVPEPESEVQSLEAPVAEAAQEEAVSLETLEPAGGVSHEAFRERYIDLSAAGPSAATRRHRYRLTPRTAREAVIWTAIFSHPKGRE